jgi:hypothetical protein
MIHQRERATFKRGFVSLGKVAAGLFRNSKDHGAAERLV